jgi:hypothetical protein
MPMPVVVVGSGAGFVDVGAMVSVDHAPQLAVVQSPLAHASASSFLTSTPHAHPRDADAGLPEAAVLWSVLADGHHPFPPI